MKFVTSTKANAAFREGNPLALYPLWRLAPDNPDWFKQRDTLRCYLAWLTTQEQKYLDLALQQIMPFDYVNKDNIRQDSFVYMLMYMKLEALMTPETRTEWIKRLVHWYDKMKECRIGDWDECVSYVGTWKLMQQQFGWNYPKEVEEYVNETMQTWAARGFTDASTEYAINTGGIICLHAAALGQDVYPWFSEWIRNFSKYLWQSVAFNGQWGENHGDTENRGLLNFFRIGLMWYAYLFTNDEQLLAVNHQLIGKSVIVPADLYPVGMEHIFLFDIYDKHLLRSDIPVQTGTFFNGAGFIMDKQVNSTIYLYYRERFPEDHDYVGSTIDVVWEKDGSLILERPGGYGSRSNEPHNHNGFLFKNCGWFWQRKVLLMDYTLKGFIIEGESYGPNERYYEMDNRRGSTDDFKACVIRSSLEYIRNKKIQILHKWHSPGTTFPE